MERSRVEGEEYRVNGTGIIEEREVVGEQRGFGRRRGTWGEAKIQKYIPR